MIIKPQISTEKNQDKKLSTAHSKLDALVDALNRRQIPPALSEEINGKISAINSLQGFSDTLTKEINSTYTEILKLIEKELQLVTKHHHRNLWMVVGMSAFGLPVGIVFSMLVGNYAFMSMGLPIGMGIGVAVGTSIDRKAATEGRQLDLD